MPVRIIALLLMMTGLFSGHVIAQQPIVLQDAVKHAITGNPDIQARWHAFQASLFEQDVARGGYFPRVDITAGAGRESLTLPNQPTINFSPRSVGLSLTQMLFDGASHPSHTTQGSAPRPSTHKCAPNFGTSVRT